MDQDVNMPDSTLAIVNLRISADEHRLLDEKVKTWLKYSPGAIDWENLQLANPFITERVRWPLISTIISQSNGHLDTSLLAAKVQFKKWVYAEATTLDNMIADALPTWDFSKIRCLGG